MTTSRSRILLTFLILLAACSGDGGKDYTFSSGGELAATVDDGVLSAVVPADGGVLIGPAGSPFEGVRVDFPAGALPADTVVTVAAGTETAPLPDFAERVGAQFTFGPADPPLAEAVEVTLPVRSDALAALNAGADAVRVWIRDGDAWSLQTTTTSDVTAVSLQVTALSTAAAGVKIQPLAARCVLCASTCPATGACVEDLGPLPVPPSTASFTGFRFVGKDATLAYVGSQNGADVGVKVTLPAAGAGAGLLASQVSQPAVGASSCCLSTPLLDDDGSLRASRTFEGAGFTRFRFGAATQLEGTSAPGIPIGLVRTADGRVARVTRNGVLDPNGAFASWPLVHRIDAFWFLATDFDRNNGFIAVSDALQQRLRRYDLGGESPSGGNTPGLNYCYSQLTSDRADGGGTNVWCLGGHANLLGTKFFPQVIRCNFPISLANPQCETYFEATGLTYASIGADSTGGLWISSADTSEVYYLNPSRVLTSHNLQTALPNLSAASLLPRDVVVLNDTTAVVVTSTNRVIRVRRQ